MSAATIGHVQTYRAFGVGRVLLANELTDQAGISWLAREMAADPGFECYVYVDSEAGVGLLGRALAAAGAARALPVLVELGFPGGRTGCRGIDAAMAVARAAAGTDGLVLAGAAGYEGGLGHDRSATSVAAVTSFCRDLRALGERLAAGAPAPGELVLSGGGSAFYDVVARELTAGWDGGAAPAVVLRSGAYVTFDHGLYASVAPGAGGPVLWPALELWTQVLSRPEPGLALACAGRRDVAFDSGLPVPLRVRHSDGRTVDVAGWEVFQLNDQHAFLRVPADAELGPGDLVCLGISHPCTTFDKWRVMPVVDDDAVVVDVIHTFF
jgi:D-serine deaminase-like pyridoxal phosphate-dependent protein